MADEVTIPAPAASAQVAQPVAETPLDPRAAAQAILRGETPTAAEPAKPEGETPAVAAPEETERLSAGFAKLARQKASLLEKQKAFDAQGAEYKAFAEAKAKIAADPAAVLELHGLTLEQVAEAYLKRSADQGEPSTDDRLAELQARIDARDKADEEARTRDNERTRAAAVDAAINVVKSVVDESVDKFPTIAATGEHGQVWEALSKYVQLHKIPESQVNTDLVRTIAAAVEQELAEEYSGLVSKVPHIAARVTAPRQPTPSAGHTTDSGAQGNSSNSLASSQTSGAPPPQPANRRYTVEELRKQALAMFAPRTA